MLDCRFCGSCHGVEAQWCSKVVARVRALMAREPKLHRYSEAEVWAVAYRLDDDEDVLRVGRAAYHLDVQHLLRRPPLVPDGFHDPEEWSDYNWTDGFVRRFAERANERKRLAWEAEQASEAERA